MIQVAVGILVSDGKVLLCQRKKISRYALKWEFPGGKVEDGETPQNCLRRELLEELNIQIDTAQLYHQQQAFYPDNGVFDVLYYLVPTFTGKIVNNMFKSYAWVPFVKLQEYEILDGNKDVVAKLLSDHENLRPEPR